MYSEDLTARPECFCASSGADTALISAKPGHGAIKIRSNKHLGRLIANCVPPSGAPTPRQQQRRQQQTAGAPAQRSLACTVVYIIYKCMLRRRLQRRIIQGGGERGRGRKRSRRIETLVRMALGPNTCARLLDGLCPVRRHPQPRSAKLSVPR